ncbi:MAG: 4'-phosphopantetheinyl transferase superfamily protein [Verrucomicrobia bacterium]|nr:4'-phosphopantetheinyl transferase superfamily protein [Verrucomicrobiota bacterium]
MRTCSTTEAVFLKAPSGEISLAGGIHVWRFALGSSDGRRSSESGKVQGEQASRLFGDWPSRSSQSLHGRDAHAPCGPVVPAGISRDAHGDESLLGPREAVQAAKFQSAGARAAFVAGRSGIRRAASLYSNIPAGELLVEIDADGKPFFSNAAVHFNLSHSGSTVVAAFSNSPVGIDIESRGRCRDFVAVASRFFHPSEAQAVAQSGDEAHFLRLWTGKEAMLKLSGEGISAGLQDVLPGDDGGGLLRGNRIGIAGFSFQDMIGTVAAFGPAEVKGWFQF